jgi:hypothetical protein
MTNAFVASMNGDVRRLINNKQPSFMKQNALGAP